MVRFSRSSVKMPLKDTGGPMDVVDEGRGIRPPPRGAPAGPLIPKPQMMGDFPGMANKATLQKLIADSKSLIKGLDNLTTSIQKAVNEGFMTQPEADTEVERNNATKTNLLDNIERYEGDLAARYPVGGRTRRRRGPKRRTRRTR